MKIKLKNINDYTKELNCSVPWDELKDSFKVYYIYENKSYIASIIYVIRLSVYALIKKINSYN